MPCNHKVDNHFMEDAHVQPQTHITQDTMFKEYEISRAPIAQHNAMTFAQNY